MRYTTVSALVRVGLQSVASRTLTAGVHPDHPSFASRALTAAVHALAGWLLVTLQMAAVR
jgi:hypothetical protein